MKIVINALSVLLIFISSFVAILFPSIMINGLRWPPGFGLIASFALIYLVSAGYSNAFSKRLSGNTIAIAILSAFLLFAVLDLSSASIKYAIKMSPLYLSWILGFVSGIVHGRNGFKLKKLILFASFPIIMSFSLYDLMMHRIDYGNFSGAVENPEVVPFEFINKEVQAISNQDLKGKVVWLDFWFIGCPPCWRIFPEVQRVYDQNRDNPEFALYAVNRFDDPQKLFTRIEEKGYTFPVVRGTQEAMDALGVYVYPTVILINKKGEVVFMGELDEAELMLADLLRE